MTSTYNPFKHLENPELARKRREEEKEYNGKKVTKEELEKSKKNAQKIFGTFNPNYKEVINKKIDLEDTNNKEENSNSKKLKQELSKTIRNKNNFQSDISNFSKISELNNINFNNKNNNFEAEVLNKIGKNYLRYKEKDGTTNYKLSLSKSIVETAKKIKEEVKNIPFDSETYKTAIRKINSKNLKEKLEGIEALYTISYNNEGKLASGTLNKFKSKQKERLKREYLKLKKQEQQLKQQSQNEQEYLKKIKEIQDKIRSVKKQAKELEKGDIFKSGKLDKNTQNNEDMKVI